MKVPSSKQLFSLILILAILAPIYMFFSYDVSILNSQYPHVVKEVNGRVDFELKSGRPKSWVPLNQISPNLKWAIILSEDWSFYQHAGVDLEQVKVALEDMVTTSKFRGASTITQQMVKNVFLSEDRTLWRKVHEIILAQKVERVLSKAKILEVYLNCIEYGPGIYGIKAASLHYFKKPPSALSPREGAFLAMMLPSPKRYYVSFKRKKLTRFAIQRIRSILIKMRMGKVITPAEYLNEVGQKFTWEN